MCTAFALILSNYKLIFPNFNVNVAYKTLIGHEKMLFLYQITKFTCIRLHCIYVFTLVSIITYMNVIYKNHYKPAQIYVICIYFTPFTRVTLILNSTLTFRSPFYQDWTVAIRLDVACYVRTQCCQRFPKILRWKAEYFLSRIHRSVHGCNQNKYNKHDFLIL